MAQACAAMQTALRKSGVSFVDGGHLFDENVSLAGAFGGSKSLIIAVLRKACRSDWQIGSSKIVKR